MYYGDRQRGKRIFILILILICLALIVYFLLKASYKLEGENETISKNCKFYNQHCVCAGLLTGEVVSVSFKPNENNKSFYCQGIEYCWDINETDCPDNMEKI